MRYQEQFPTIWDTPLKTTAPTDQAATRKATAKPQPSPFKEAFLTIWDSTKAKPPANVITVSQRLVNTPGRATVWFRTSAIQR